MAKHVHDRENLLRDATAMPLRGQTVIDGKEVFIGFRTGTQMSLYWDQDPVFQFDDSASLRRVFSNGNRYVASSGKLVVREPTERSQGTANQRLRLSHRELSREESNALLELLAECLDRLKAHVAEAGRTAWIVADEDSLHAYWTLLERTIEKINRPIRIASGPAA